MHYDAIVIGGSYAGISAALVIARARRTVFVVDAGAPRNRFAAAAHGFFGQDGAAPRTMIENARRQLSAYPTVTFSAGEAVAAERTSADLFTVRLSDGRAISSSRLLLTHGVSDTLPELAGLAERWGHTVLHCPYCHGYEFAGRPLGVLYVRPISVHQALLVSDWGPTTLFLDGHDALDEKAERKLAARQVTVERARVVRLEGDAPQLTGVRLADDRIVAVDALFLAPITRVNPLAEMLGCALDEGPTGQYIKTEPTKRTSVPGVYAAGDAALLGGNAMIAAADGVVAGSSLHQSLIPELTP